MSRYNHFSKAKYKSISFGELEVGARFRMDSFSNGRRRSDIIMVKLSPLSYKEIRSKKETTVHHSAFDVSCYDELSIPINPNKPHKAMRWIKASEGGRPDAKPNRRINIKYKGSPNVLCAIGGAWYWYDEKNPTEYIVHTESWLAIEWLDEQPVPGLREVIREMEEYKGIEIVRYFLIQLKSLTDEPDAGYWKKRCEAAEAVLDRIMEKRGTPDPYSSTEKKLFNSWQKLKSSPNGQNL